MGTSSIYGGPVDRNPLLPEGFEDEQNSGNEGKDGEEKKQEEDVKSKGSWQETKKAMSQYINGSSSSKGRVVSNYVKASGGSRAAAKQSSSGKNSTIQLGRFLSSISKIGIIKTLENLKIDYIGKSVETLLSEIVNVISAESNLKEDGVARNATIEALYEIYNFIDKNDMDISSLDRMDETIFEQIMNSYVSTYIFEKMLNALQSRFEQYAETKEATRIESEFKDYIKASVEIKLNEAKLGNLDYNSNDIGHIIENLYTECYRVLEVCL